MAACSSGVARPGVSSITETRYCISDHLLWFGAPLVGGLSSLLRTPSPRSDTAPGFLSRTFWYAGCKRSDSATVSGRLRSTSSCAPSADELWDQIDREALTRRLGRPCGEVPAVRGSFSVRPPAEP